MSLTLINPMNKVAERISAYYVAHPDLLENLLMRIGCKEIRHRWGHHITGTCPIHNGDNSRGFFVYYDRGFPVWQCYSDHCGRGGLVKLILKRWPNATYDQAVVSLGRACGITVDGAVLNVSPKMVVEETLDVVQRRLGIDPNRRQQKINVFPEEMVGYSVSNLYQSNVAGLLHYLTAPKSTRSPWGEKNRQLPPHIIQQFQLGFVPSRKWVWNDKETNKPTGWFEDRISIPWRTVDGVLMGFAGKRIDGVDFMKYKTLPGTGRALTLYGLGDPRCIAEIRRTGVLHLVEGYSDVWRGHAHGCHNIAAVGGTELTPEQRRLLERLGVTCIILYFDGDEAGINASQSIGKQLHNTFKVLAALPPLGSDPDDLVDYAAFWTPIVQAKPFVLRNIR